MKTHALDGGPKLAADWQVTQCACGHLTLRLGTIRIEFTPQEFAQLEKLVAGAMKSFDVAAADAESVYGKPITH